MEPTTIVTAMTGAKHLLDLTKNALEGTKKLENAEYTYKMSEIVLAAAQLNTDLANMKSEVLEKDNKIRDLEAALKQAADMEHDGVFYYRKQGDKKDGPFCAQCFDSEKKAIRLHNYQEGWWECKTCESRYEADWRAGDAKYESLNRRAMSDYDPVDGG